MEVRSQRSIQCQVDGKNGRPVLFCQKGAADTGEVALIAAKKREQQTHPERTREEGKAHLVVLGVKWVGTGPQKREFLGVLAATKARSGPLILQSTAKAARVLRWSCLVVCVARGVRSVLVGGSPVPRSGWCDPSTQ